MTLTRKARFWIGGILIGVGLISAVISVYRGPVPTLAIPVPNPNGYDDFIAAAQMRANVAGDVPSPHETNFNLTLRRTVRRR